MSLHAGTCIMAVSDSQIGVERVSYYMEIEVSCMFPSAPFSLPVDFVLFMHLNSEQKK